MHVHVFETVLPEGSHTAAVLFCALGLGRPASVELFFCLLQVCETHEQKPHWPPESRGHGVSPVVAAQTGALGESVSRSVMPDFVTLDCRLPGSFVHGDSPGKNTDMCCHCLLQGIFLTQGLKAGLLHCRQILYCLSHQGK